MGMNTLINDNNEAKTSKILRVSFYSNELSIPTDDLIWIFSFFNLPPFQCFTFAFLTTCLPSV